MSVSADERHARAALSLHTSPDAAHCHALWRLGAVEAWERAAANRRAEGRPVADVAGILAAAAETGIRFAVPGDDEWPRGLAQLRAYVLAASSADAHRAGRDVGEPYGLWVRGGPLAAAVPAVAVAVVGSRAASAYGLSVAMDIGMGLAERGIDVVSGAAYGIDAAAHRGALAAGGRTVAVLACGVDVAYPRDHEVLLDVIAREGVIASEAPPGAAPGRGTFLRRNRLIAALGEGVVLVEAGMRSGARNTVAHARALGVRRMVIPGPVTSASSAGCHATLRGDDVAVLVTSAAEVVEEAGRVGDLAPLQIGPLDPRDGLGTLARDVLECLPASGGRSVAELAEALGVRVADVRAVAAALAEAGLIGARDEVLSLTALGRRPTARAG